MALSTTKGSTLSATLSKTAAFGGSASFPFNATVLGSTLTSGTGADKADQLYPAQFTLGAGETMTLNLYTMAQNGLTAPTDPLGAAMTFATIKHLLVQSLGNLGCTYVTAATISALGNGGSGYTNGAQILTLVGGNYLGAVAIHAGGGGTGYTVGDVLTIAGGTGNAATVKVLTAPAGVIGTLAVLSRGTYTLNPGVTSNGATGGTGTGASLDLTMLASTPAQLAVNVSGGIVQAVLNVSVPGSYVVLPPASLCPCTGAGGSGATFDLTLATRVIANAVFTAGDNLTLGGLGTTAAWTSLLSPNTATCVLRAGTSNLPGTWEASDGGSTGYVVGSGATNNILKVTNSGANPVTFELVAIGATA